VVYVVDEQYRGPALERIKRGSGASRDGGEKEAVVNNKEKEIRAKKKGVCRWRHRWYMLH